MGPGEGREAKEMRFFTTEAQRTLGVLLLVTVVVIAAVASGLVLLKGPVSAAFSSGLTQPNVLLTCPTGTYVANHLCVANCPLGFGPVAYDSAQSPICMSPDNRPVSVYDLAAAWVSADGGATVFFIVETVPLAKLPSTTQNWPVSVWLPVSQAIIDALPTVPTVPTVTTLVATIGDKVGTFTIKQIGLNVVEGVFYNPWPLCCFSMNRTITVGDDIGISCEGVSIILESINFSSQIAVFQRTLTSSGRSCPICLSGDTIINTLNGPLNVKNVTVGTPVWTVDRFGRKTTGTVLEVRKSPVPSIHEVVHIVLQDGRQLYASPAHPTADGRTFGELRQGDILDNSVLTVVELVPYGQAYTYDLLPSGDTGFYWANNILVGSTLSPA